MPTSSPPRPPTNTARPSLLPSPFPHSTSQASGPETVHAPYSPSANVDSGTRDPHSDNEDEGVDEYPDPRDEDGESLLPPPAFHPFFTLITDTTSGETYHPRTYYIFTDDDPDILTTATLHALDSQSSYPREGEEEEGDGGQEEERYLVMDMSDDATRVREIKSLTSNWAVTSSEIRGAPTFQPESGVTAAGGNEGLMLMIEGVSRPSESKGADTSGGGKGVDKAVRETERKIRAREKFEEARRKGQGDILKGMEELAVGMGGALGVLDRIVGV